MNVAVAAAVRERRRIRFVYNGEPRLAEPQCDGVGATGNGLLLVHQLQGGSEREPWFDVSKLTELVVLDERFTQPGPNDRQNDCAMRSIDVQL